MTYKITVEPVLLLYMLSTYMLYPALQDLIYTKVCLNKYSASTCKNLDDPSNSEALDNVQKSSSHWILGSTFMLAVPSIFSAQFLGSWSDIYGRKLPMIIPPLGAAFASLVYIGLCVNLEDWPVSLILLSSFFSGITGGFSSCILICMSYITEVTSVQTRTVRVGILESMIFIGGTTGPLLTGWINSSFGRGATFVTIMALFSTIILYIVGFVDDVAPRNSTDITLRKDCCTLEHLKNPVVNLLKSRTAGRRFTLLLLLLSAAIIVLTTQGELDISYIYLADKPIGWNLSTFTGYLSLKFGLGSFSLLFILPIFRNAPDSMLIVAGLISRMLGYIILGFAKTSAAVYASATVSFLYTWSIPVIRAAMSKLVEPHEQGKMFACVAMLENLCGVAATLIFNSLYPLTRDWCKGFIYFLEVCLLLAPFITICVLHNTLKRLNYSEMIGEEAGERRDSASSSDSSVLPSPASSSSPPASPHPSPNTYGKNSAAKEEILLDGD